jgi:hypothetical protein
MGCSSSAIYGAIILESLEKKLAMPCVEEAYITGKRRALVSQLVMHDDESP